jgi:hypothetical protein
MYAAVLIDKTSHVKILLFAVILACITVLTSSAQDLQHSCRMVYSAKRPATIDNAYNNVNLSNDGFFAVHWNASGDSACSESLVEQVLESLVLARSTYQNIDGSWDIPLGNREHYPVYIAATSFPGATSSPYSENGFDGLSWIVLDNDFTPYGGDPTELLRVTAAHELFHAFQFARSNSGSDIAFYEASAVWAEDQVYPDADDWVDRYLGFFLATLDQPLTMRDGWREYGAAAAIKYFLRGEQNAWMILETIIALDGDQRSAWQILLDLSITNSIGAADTAWELAQMTAVMHTAGTAANLYSASSWIAEYPEFPVADLSGIQFVFDPEVGPVDLPGSLELIAPLSTKILGFDYAARLSVTHLFAQNSGLWLGDNSFSELNQISIADTIFVGRQSRLYIVNSAASDRMPQIELHLLNTISEPNNDPGFSIFPNPAGSLRQVKFDGFPSRLEFYDIAGRKVFSWQPADQSSQQTLLLPDLASGPIYVRKIGIDEFQALIYLRQ